MRINSCACCRDPGEKCGLLVGQVLWVEWQQLFYAAIISLAVLVVWIRSRAKIGSLGFCLLFAITIVQAIVIAALLLKLAIPKNIG